MNDGFDLQPTLYPRCLLNETLNATTTCAHTLIIVYTYSYAHQVRKEVMWCWRLKTASLSSRSHSQNLSIFYEHIAMWPFLRIFVSDACGRQNSWVYYWHWLRGIRFSFNDLPHDSIVVRIHFWTEKALYCVLWALASIFWSSARWLALTLTNIKTDSEHIQKQESRSADK